MKDASLILHYLDLQLQLMVAATRKIRTDYETENGDAAAFQTFQRRNDPDDDRPYIYGTSTRNQRTES